MTTAELSNSVSQPLILIADDNFDNRFIASTMLRHSGYRVIEAVNGGAAIRLARAEHPALILMDIGMPDIDGWTATRVLKDDPQTRKTIILAFTAHALPGAADQAREAGCDGYLAKPISPGELVRSVGAALAAT